jgi:hypothetical protein
MAHWDVRGTARHQHPPERDGKRNEVPELLALTSASPFVVRSGPVASLGRFPLRAWDLWRGMCSEEWARAEEVSLAHSGLRGTARH